MYAARAERMAAANLPQANVVSILYVQHAQLRDQFSLVPDLPELELMDLDSPALRDWARDLLAESREEQP